MAGKEGTIVAYIPTRGEFVFIPSGGHRRHLFTPFAPKPTLLNLSEYWITCDPMAVPTAPLRHLAAIDTKMFECQVCLEVKAAGGFKPFCFRHFHITGDGFDLQDPRHPREICKSCLKEHAVGESARLTPPVTLPDTCARGHGRPVLETKPAQTAKHSHTHHMK